MTTPSYNFTVLVGGHEFNIEAGTWQPEFAGSPLCMMLEKYIRWPDSDADDEEDDKPWYLVTGLDSLLHAIRDGGVSLLDPEYFEEVLRFLEQGSQAYTPHTPNSRSLNYMRMHWHAMSALGEQHGLHMMSILAQHDCFEVDGEFTHANRYGME